MQQLLILAWMKTVSRAADERFYLGGLVCLSSHDPPSFDRTTYILMLALVVGQARMALSYYLSKGCPEGRSVRAFKKWLLLNDENGAHEMLLHDLEEEVRLSFLVDEGEEIATSSQLSNSPSASVAKEPVSTNSSQGIQQAVISNPEEARGQDVQGTLQAPRSAAATTTTVTFRYEMPSETAGSGSMGGAGGAGGTRVTAYLDDTGGSGNGNSPSVGERTEQMSFGNSYADPAEDARLVIAVLDRAIMSCSLTEGERVELRSLHERVARRLSGDMKLIFSSALST